MNNSIPLLANEWKLMFLILTLVAGLISSCSSVSSDDDPIHIVFVIGDEEYRSEESMPVIGEILKRELNARVTYCHSVDSAGFIDPNRLNHIEGLDALLTADLMVMFTRFRALPGDELKYIIDYAESGKPMVGFRTSTHAFLYKEDSTLFHMNNEWPTRVFGQQWITHHGHFDDGQSPLSEVSIVIELADHPILRGVQPFLAYSWLYHVDGGSWKLYGDSRPLVMGKAIKSNHEINNRLEAFPLQNPVAWTKKYTGAERVEARVFFTTLGHPYDFRVESMRRLSVQGIYWALGMEDLIPENGVNVDLAAPYHPNNSGFGNKFKKGLTPVR